MQAVFYLSSSTYGKQLEERLRVTEDNDFESWGGDFVKIAKLRTRLTLRRRKTTKSSQDGKGDGKQDSKRKATAEEKGGAKEETKEEAQEVAVAAGDE